MQFSHCIFVYITERGEGLCISHCNFSMNCRFWNIQWKLWNSSYFVQNFECLVYKHAGYTPLKLPTCNCTRTESRQRFMKQLLPCHTVLNAACILWCFGIPWNLLLKWARPRMLRRVRWMYVCACVCLCVFRHNSLIENRSKLLWEMIKRPKYTHRIQMIETYNGSTII